MPGPETATIHLAQTALPDAPPGITAPPDLKQATIQEPARIASKLEAIFSSKITLRTQENNQDIESLPVIDPLANVPKELLLSKDLIPTRKRIRDEVLSGFTCKMQARSDWFLSLRPKLEYTLPTMRQPYILNGAAEDLESRQSEITRDDRHGETLLFLAANWNKIAQIFTKDEIPKNTHLRRWVEVDLNNLLLFDENDDSGRYLTCGRIDLVGELPDGQLVIIDVKTSKHNTAYRTRQLAKQTLGLRELMRQHNPHTQLPQISQFLSIYDHANRKPTVITLLPKSDMYLPYLANPESEHILFQSPITAA
jgi:hypothetical protein